MSPKSVVVLPRNLSAQQRLNLANVYLENAHRAKDLDITLVLCHDAEESLLQAREATKNQFPLDGIATVYIALEKLLEERGCDSMAKAFRKKAEEEMGRHTKPASRSGKQTQPNMSALIFAKNVGPPVTEFKPPEANERLVNTQQLASCLGLLEVPYPNDDVLEPETRKWLEAIRNDTDEQERLKTMATEVVRAFKSDALKDDKVVAEVVYLAPVLSKDDFKKLLQEFYSGIDHSGLLDVHLLEGMAQLIQGARLGYLDADDLVKILELLNTRLQDTHQESNQMQLTLAVSHVLDALADTHVKNLDRETLQEPLSAYFGVLKKSNDPYLVYQAAYAHQALLCVPDNETLWQETFRRAGKVIQGVVGLVGAVKSVDPNRFIEGFQDIQKGIEGAYKFVNIVKNALPSKDSGRDFVESLNNGLNVPIKREWYSVLRVSDILIRDGDLATFRKLVCEASCRSDPAFQWGVCQRLGEIAVNPRWDENVREDAIAFLGELYRENAMWGKEPRVKEWILRILMQLRVPVAEALLEGLKADGDNKKRNLYNAVVERSPVSYPLKAAPPKMASPSLLDRVQNRPNVERSIRLLKKRRTSGRDNTVYIQPQAKPGLQAADSARFPLMDKVNEFLTSDQKVFLVLGDSGAGKSTFNRELELDLWNSYKEGSRIPLFINLAAVDKPEHDLVAKQLRKAEFTDPQIRELKHSYKFVLICDGYDESQQTRNLFTSNGLNQPDEWDTQMVISCRTEYLGVDYRARFQPGDRNQPSDSLLFQEAVILPFSRAQIQEYITQYISIRQTLWSLEDYKKALKRIPTLKELVRNPFLLTVSLEVLPRMIDLDHNLSAEHVTRVGLYDRFVEQWLERSKRRLSEKDLPIQSRAIFERLSDEGFAQNGIDFMKRLAVAIFKDQGGKSIVEYTQFLDEGSWKDEFFFREDKQLLREACPLIRNGNQHRFIHRSLLEYGLALAVFDPHDRRKRSVSEPALNRRGSVSSILSFEDPEDSETEAAAVEQEPDDSSPLVWRNFVSDHSLLHFLQERVHQEPLFKKQLHDYIEHSKKDKKWRKAAANAITILVRAGVQFIGADLPGIQIPGADLSYGVFDSAQLQDADLRKVNFRGTWLRQTDMTGAKMTGARFGELPSLVEDGEVYSCAYSPDGNSIAVGLENGSINLYTTSTWERFRTLNGDGLATTYIVYSPNSDQIASSSNDRTVRLWNPETGALQHTLSHPDCVRCVAYSPQGDQVASACGDNIIRLWDVVSGTCRQLSGHTDKVTCIAYSPNGHQIASGSRDHTVRLWNIEKGDCSRILSDHIDTVWGIAYSPQGNQAASASEDTTVRLWNVKTGKCSCIIKGHLSTVICVAYSPKGDQIASGGVDATVRIWDVESGHGRHTLTGHSGAVRRVVYSPNGNQIASGSLDKTVRLWDVSAASSNSVSNGHSLEVSSVKCSPNGDLIASCSADRTVRLWDVDTGAYREVLRGHKDSVFGIAFSPGGNQIASGSSDKTVRLWDTEAGTCLVLKGHSQWVECVAYSPEGNTVASASADGTVKLWDVRTGEQLKTLRGHKGAVMTVTYSSNGRHIATGSKDLTVRIWDVGSGACIRTLVGHTDCVRDVAYSPLGDQLASAGYDKTIRLWDVATGECQAVLTGHSDRVKCVAYSEQDDDLLASGSWDKTVRLWHVASGECLAEIKNLPDAIYSIAWIKTSDANFLVTGSGYGSMLKWKVISEGKPWSMRLCWRATNGTLVVTGATMENVHDLSSTNKLLLTRRGASILEQSSAGTATDSISDQSFLGAA
ncbi:MAG: WD40-repeat-containing domain protein [Benniella sp.]|nr:MAG: WD40-repeat-containing domain protein [Benniella sp.]